MICSGEPKLLKQLDGLVLPLLRTKRHSLKFKADSAKMPMMPVSDEVEGVLLAPLTRGEYELSELKLNVGTGEALDKKVEKKLKVYAR